MSITRRTFAAAGAGALVAQTRKRPNVVIFYVDELRATALQMYYPDGVATPNLARLASRGVLFTHGFTPHPLCMPARVSLWTGQYSRTHGSRNNLVPMKDDRQSMAGMLHEAGYRTGIFGKNHCFTPAQLQRWFDIDYSFAANNPALPNALHKGLSPEKVQQIQNHWRWIRDHSGRASASPFPPDIFETHLINQRAMEFIEHEAAGPFAAWISILDPHPPIQAPEEFAHTVPPEKVKLPPFREGEMKTKNTRMQIFDHQLRGSELPESFLRQYLSVYYGMVAFIDSEVGRLMKLLDSKGLTENTIVVFTSDHGDYAAEHHLIYKSGSLLDCMVRVPFLVSWPGHLPEGKREDALVNQVDIMPTLLELCGLKIPSQVEGQRLPFKPGDKRRDFVYAEYGAGGKEYTWDSARELGPPNKPGVYTGGTEAGREGLMKRETAGHLRMIRTRKQKLIRDSNGEAEFYDLEKDPYELENLHGRPHVRQAEEELAAKFTA